MPYQWTTGETITAAKLNLQRLDILIVGGGGGGGFGQNTPSPAFPARLVSGSGGGGGGAFMASVIPEAPYSYTVVIGAGGPGYSPGVPAGAGTASSFGSFTSNGGGAGGAYNGGASGNGNPGGTHAGFPSSSPYSSGQYSSGGGGGAAAQGNTGAMFGTSAIGVPGGAGLYTEISGSLEQFGKGGDSRVGVVNGPANTGYGGGGSITPGDAGSGGSGKVVIRYPGSTKATGGTITTANGYTVHTFTSGPATFTWTG